MPHHFCWCRDVRNNPGWPRYLDWKNSPHHQWPSNDRWESSEWQGGHEGALRILDEGLREQGSKWWLRIQVGSNKCFDLCLEAQSHRVTPWSEEAGKRTWKTWLLLSLLLRIKHLQKRTQRERQLQTLSRRCMTLPSAKSGREAWGCPGTASQFSFLAGKSPGLIGYTSSNDGFFHCHVSCLGCKMHFLGRRKIVKNHPDT